MSATSDIEWTDATWNPVKGCTKVSPGCARCYAETFAERFRGVPGHPFEQGFDLKLWPERLGLPLRWKKPKRIFVNSMSDLFHESVPDEFIDRVFATMARAHWHTFQLLSKRPERMRAYVSGLSHREAAHYVNAPSWPLPNVWLGTSIENQHWADIRVPQLLATPAAVRLLSCEPLLGPLDIREWLPVNTGGRYGRLYPRDAIGWVIAGGESGPGARPMDVAWVRSLRDQCRSAGVPYFLKQMGARPITQYDDWNCWPVVGRDAEIPGGRPQDEEETSQPGHVVVPLKSRKGGDMAEWPNDLRVREMPV